MENRLATIVFIDMQGYTKRSAQQTIEEMKLFHDEMFNFVKTHLEKYQGIMVKTLGDGFLARFESPTQAVQCGLEMQRKLESRNAQMLNPDSIVRFRIGINTGEIGIDESGDVFGDPVNIASRIQSYAEPNEVYISESTFLAMNRNEVGAQDLGMQMFKNATREIRIYKILKQGSPGLVLPAPAMKGGAKASPEQTEAGSSTKPPPPWQTWLKLGAGIFVVLMFLNGVRHTFRRQQTPTPTPGKAITATTASTAVKPPMPGANPPALPAPNTVAQKQPTPPQPPPAANPPTGTSAATHVNTGQNQPPDGSDDDGQSGQGIPLSPLDIDPDNAPPALALNPKQKKILKDLKELRKAGKLNEAIKLAQEQEESVKQAPPHKRVDYYVLLGQLYQEAGQKQASLEAFNNARASIGAGPLKKRMLEMRIQNIIQRRVK